MGLVALLARLGLSGVIMSKVVLCLKSMKLRGLRVGFVGFQHHMICGKSLFESKLLFSFYEAKQRSQF